MCLNQVETRTRRAASVRTGMIPRFELSESLAWARARRTARDGFAALIALLVLLHAGLSFAQGGREAQKDISDISGEYHFLAPDDTLGLLEEEGRVKGFVEVFQGEEESDTILSFPITIGSRTGEHVEFKTAKIHERYYRFSGTVERGKGRGPKDADYLRLAGDLKVVTVSSEDGKETVEGRAVTFKSLSADERAEREQD